MNYQIPQFNKVPIPQYYINYISKHGQWRTSTSTDAKSDKNLPINVIFASQIQSVMVHWISVQYWWTVGRTKDHQCINILFINILQEHWKPAMAEMKQTIKLQNVFQLTKFVWGEVILLCVHWLSYIVTRHTIWRDWRCHNACMLVKSSYILWFHKGK